MDKNRLGSRFAEAKDTAKERIGKVADHAVQAIDQNNDGKLNLADVAIAAGAIGGAMKKGALAVKEHADDNRQRKDQKRLQPVFSDDLDVPNFITNLIHITDRDKKYIDNPVATGSIGYVSDKDNYRVINIFKDSLDKFGLTFYPDPNSEFYYVNPTDKGNYISLDEYFDCLRVVRVNELQRVAQDLGAKHFKVTYKEERTSFSNVKGKAQLKVGKNNAADATHDNSEKSYSKVDIAAEMDMTGHAPQEPKLVYLAKDDSVRNLIHLRMKGGEDFHHHKISIKLSNSSGLKKTDAAKIDAVLKGLKMSGNATVSSEVQNEARRYLEYEIDF